MKREYIFSLLAVFFILISSSSFSQVDISGIINVYSSVDSIYPTKDTIEVSNSSLFNANDTVMVYQAKGAVARTDTSTLPAKFGEIPNDNINGAGKYEIILVQKVEGNQVILKAFLTNDYDTDQFVQLIRVPSYKSAKLSSVLTCETWNGATGGVVALMVSDTLFLDARIDVSGKGFRGAVPFFYDTVSYGSNCSSVDSALYGSAYFDENTSNVSAGYKGEGVSEFEAAYRKGLGRWASGGGGGNARFSGGGGGGNSGQGGFGGEEDNTICITPAFENDSDYGGYWNALGGSGGFGLGKSGMVNDSTIFLGGGGGAGVYKAETTASDGGNGGGIVIIIARVIESYGDSIVANGESVMDTVDASGGGGGAGGSVVFDIESVIGNLNVSCEGGVGGTVEKYGHSGPGGGGAGGAVLWNSTKPDNVNINLDGGISGLSKDKLPDDTYTHMASEGESGFPKINIKVPLTGFLFNSITPNHAVCMNSKPQLLTGTDPRGGTGVYGIQWYESPDGSTWLPIAGATEKDYQPNELTDTTYYQRIVTSGTVIDKGNIIRIVVHDYVVNNNISMPLDSVICLGNPVGTSIGTRVILGGNNVSYQYIWEYSFDSIDWTTATGALDTAYTHGEITDQKTFIRRKVISGACEDTAYLNNPIIGLLPISNNIMPPEKEVCQGQVPEEIIPGVVSDGLGAGTYTYQWQQSSDAINWVDISGATNENYQPFALIDTTYYRRIVYSDDCFDESDTLLISVLHPIDNDFIETGDLIYTCYNTAPVILNGSTPINGDEGNYTYEWKESTDGISWVSITESNVEDYQPGILTSKTYFKRFVSSGLAGCCTSETDSIIVDIYALPIATITTIKDTSCSGDEKILNINFTEGQDPFTVTYNDGYDDSTLNPINGYAYNLPVQPTTDAEEKEYNYTLVSITDNNGCIATDMSGTATIVVYGVPVSNAGIDDEICELRYNLDASPSSIATGIWSEISNQGSFIDPTNPKTTFEVTGPGTYNCIWKETNWHCTDADTMEITLYTNISNIKILQPDSILAEQNIDTIIFNNTELNVLGYYENESFDEKITETWITDNNSIVILPSFKSASFTWTEEDDVVDFQINWTVDKGVCKDTTLNLNISVRDYIFIPNGFTPNGDGVNDKIVIDGLKDTDKNVLIIYNRWGTEVFRSEDFSNDEGWDGKNDKEKDLPEDTYFYVLNRNKPSGRVVTDKGFIVLKRF